MAQEQVGNYFWMIPQNDSNDVEQVGGKKKENDHALNYKEISLRDHRNGPSRPISPKL